MNETEINSIKNRIEKEFRKNITNNLNGLHGYPDELRGTMLEMDANIFINNMKEAYDTSLSAAQKANQSLGISRHEWDSMIDELTSRVLSEYIVTSEPKKKSWFSNLFNKK